MLADKERCPREHTHTLGRLRVCLEESSNISTYDAVRSYAQYRRHCDDESGCPVCNARTHNIHVYTCIARANSQNAVHTSSPTAAALHRPYRTAANKRMNFPIRTCTQYRCWLSSSPLSVSTSEAFWTPVIAVVATFIRSTTHIFLVTKRISHFDENSRACFSIKCISRGTFLCIKE